MKSLMTILKNAILTAVAGAVIGWTGGFLFYELVSVPQAQGMNPMERDSFLCSQGQAPVAFALLGIILGATFGSGIGGGVTISNRRANAKLNDA